MTAVQAAFDGQLILGDVWLVGSVCEDELIIRAAARADPSPALFEPAPLLDRTRTPHRETVTSHNPHHVRRPGLLCGVGVTGGKMPGGFGVELLS
ncbi:hypothetical protein GCM10023321_38970 [Pseudonocardia eucalypti]|uniref:Uncharacterized protein n=1 Tax=Pseudonocardia eucalypti TaxID=648755 RepID=A0ABP9Q8V7_9PSEU|nr:hypothetical protein [Pseudonocardia eucalypti]